MRKAADVEQTIKPFIETAIRLLALGLLLYWALILIRPFIAIFIWSAVLTVALYPVFQWLAGALGGRRRLAAFIVTALSLLVVIGPVAWIGIGLIDSVRIIAERIDRIAVAVPAPSEAVKDWPVVGHALYRLWDMASNNMDAVMAKVVPQLQSIAGSVVRIGANTGVSVLKFLVAIIVAGFLFAPAPALQGAVTDFARRLNPTHGSDFVAEAGATIRAVARGVIGISVLQSSLAGLGLVAAGIPQASLITFGVLVLGIIQIGPSILVIPVIIWSWTLLDTGPAVVFTAYMMVVNLLDNFLKPIVMGRGLKTPMLVILIGVLGGTLAYGITGLFLGPIVLAVIWELVLAWVKESK